MTRSWVEAENIAFDAGQHQGQHAKEKPAFDALVKEGKLINLDCGRGKVNKFGNFVGTPAENSQRASTPARGWGSALRGAPLLPLRPGRRPGWPGDATLDA